MRLTAPILLLLSLLPFMVQAQQRFASGPQPVALLELYTSEGCSSCPPADRWFSTLADSPLLWTAVVPVAFHVDYWDMLGWPDRFASEDYSQRQRDYRRQRTTSGVYTPGMVLAGGEWHQWRRGEQPAAAGEGGELELTVGEQGDFTASYGAAGAGRLHVAILGFGLQTPVQRGENRGRVLQHDFVVLGHAVYPGSDDRWRGALPPAPLAAQARRLAIAAWVSPASKQLPLQAVGGWLDPGTSLRR